MRLYNSATLYQSRAGYQGAGARIGRYLALWLLSLMLVGCSILPQSPGLQSYLLPSAPADALPGTQQVQQTLRIATPQTSQFLNSVRIAVQPAGDEIAVYKGIRWNDTAPAVLRERLLQAFRQTQVFKWVVSDQDNVRADTELRTDLTAFQIMYAADGSRQILIRLSASLVDLDQRTVLASRQFEIEQPVVGKGVAPMITAFGVAGDQLSAQLVRWSLAASHRQ
ncbi:MAG: ABC-type transport auxiliary lipoprotein family protein [Enterobacteriaceae bacterium]